MNQLARRITFLAALAVPPLGAQETPPSRLVVDTLAAGLYRVAAPPDGTVLFWTGAGGPVLVDALSMELAPRLDSLVGAIGGGPLRAVVNTHYHADHTGMNRRARAAGAALYAHPRARVEMARDTTITELDWHRAAAPADALPTVLVADSVLLGTGGSRVLVLAIPPAHTGGDLLVHFLEADVLHTGDVVEIGAFPFVDRWAGGSIDGLIGAVDLVLARSGSATRIVPGHGPVTDRQRVTAYRSMLAGARERVAEAVAAGRDAASVLADPWIAALAPAWGSANQLRYFVRSMHEELDPRRQGQGSPES